MLSCDAVTYQWCNRVTNLTGFAAHYLDYLPFQLELFLLGVYKLKFGI